MGVPAIGSDLSVKARIELLLERGRTVTTAEGMNMRIISCPSSAIHTPG